MLPSSAMHTRYSNIEEVPDDLLGQILGFLTVDYIVQEASKTSKHFRGVILRSNLLWRHSYATTWKTRLSKMDTHQDWKHTSLTRYKLHFVRAKTLFDTIGPRFDQLYDRMELPDDRAKLAEDLKRAEEIFIWNADCRAALKRVFFQNLPADPHDNYGYEQTTSWTQAAHKQALESFKAKDGFDLVSQYVYNIHYVECHMEAELSQYCKFMASFVLYNLTSGLPVPFTVVFERDKNYRRLNDWELDQEDKVEEHKKLRFMILRLSVASEGSDLVLVDNNTMDLNAVNKMKHLLFGSLGDEVSDEVIMSFIWTVGYTCDPTHKNPYDRSNVSKLCYIMSFVQVPLGSEQATKQKGNGSIIPKIELPEWIRRMVPAQEITTFKQKTFYKRKGKWCGGRPRTSTGMIDISQRRMFAEILPNVLRRGPYRLDIIERVHEMIVLATMGSKITQWLNKQVQSLPEISILRQITNSKHFFTPADPHGDYGYNSTRFDLHESEESHCYRSRREKIYENGFFVLHSVLSQKSCDIKINILFEMADDFYPARSTLSLSSKCQVVAKVFAVCTKGEGGAIKYATVRDAEIDKDLTICKFALLRKNLFGSTTTEFSLAILIRFLYEITHASQEYAEFSKQADKLEPGHAEALLQAFVQEFNELWISSSSPNVNTDEVENPKTQVDTAMKKQQEERARMSLKMQKQQARMKQNETAAKSAQVVESEPLPISAHYLSSKCEMEIIKFVPGNPNKFLINEAGYFVDLSTWPVQLHKTEFSLRYPIFSDDGKQCMGFHVTARDWGRATNGALCAFNQIPFTSDTSITVRIECVRQIDDDTVVPGVKSAVTEGEGDGEGENTIPSSEKKDTEEYRKEPKYFHDDVGRRVELTDPIPNMAPKGIGFIDGRMLIGVHFLARDAYYYDFPPMYFYLQSKQGSEFRKTNLPPACHAKTFTLPDRSSSTPQYARSAVAVQRWAYQFNTITEQFETLNIICDKYLGEFFIESSPFATFTYNDVLGRLFYTDHGSLFELFWLSEDKMVLAEHLPGVVSTLTAVQAGALGLILIVRQRIKDPTCCVLYKLAPLSLRSEYLAQREVYLQRQKQHPQAQEQQENRPIRPYDQVPSFYRDIALSGSVIIVPFTAFGLLERYVRQYHGCSDNLLIQYMYNFAWSEPLQMLIALHDTSNLTETTLRVDAIQEGFFTGTTILRGITKQVLEEQFKEEKVADLVDLEQGFKDSCYSTFQVLEEDEKHTSVRGRDEYSRASWIYSTRGMGADKQFSVFAYWERTPGLIPRYWFAPEDKIKKPFTTPQGIPRARRNEAKSEKRKAKSEKRKARSENESSNMLVTHLVNNRSHY